MTSTNLQINQNTQISSAQNKPSSADISNKAKTHEALITNNTNRTKDNYFNPKTITGSLVGLATLGACIWKFKKPFGAKSIPLQPAPSSEHLSNEISILSTQINKMKKLLREDYIAQKTLIINKMNKFGEFDFKFPFTNLNELKQHVLIQKRQHEFLTQKAGALINENRQTIRNKLTELFKNPEWVEIKGKRKQLLKTLKTTKSPDEKQIANHKIKIINDLMINRIYPEEMAEYKSIYGIEDNKAIEFVRKNHTSYQEYINEWNSMKNPISEFPFTQFDRRFTHTDKLSLGDLFKTEVQTIVENEKAIKETAEKLALVENLDKEYHQRLQNLAQQYRHKQDVLDLKEQILTLSSLKNTLGNAA